MTVSKKYDTIETVNNWLTLSRESERIFKMTLTKVQKTHLENLRSNGKLYVGNNSPQIMRSFEALVRKGYAQVKKEYPGYGKDFVATQQ